MKNHRWATYFGLLILTYFTPFFFHFAHHDQYRHFRIPAEEKLACDNDNQNRGDTQYRGLFYDLGRPVAAVLECWQFMTTHNRADLNWHRLISLATIATFFFLLVYGFRSRLALDNEHALALALTICVLPGLLNLFIMANYAVISGLITASGAFVLLNFGFVGEVIAFVVLCISLFTYPMSAFLFLALASAEFLFSKKKIKESIQTLTIQFAMLVAGCGVFVTVVKLVLHPVVSYDERDVRSPNAFRISTDILGRIIYYANGFKRALNFWNIYSSWILASGVVAAVVWLLVRYIKVRGLKKELKWKIAVSIAAPIIVFSPIGLTNMQELLYRTMIGLSTSLILTIFWLLQLNYRIPKWTCSIFAVLVTVVSGFNVAMSAWNSSMEMDYLVAQIKDRNLLNNRILFVKNVERDASTLGMNGLPTVSDEFNINTTTYNREENTFIMRAALVEAGGDPRIHVYLCVTPEDCGRAEQIIQTMPFVYVVVKQNDTTGFPPRYPIIDMEQFSR